MLNFIANLFPDTVISHLFKSYTVLMGIGLLSGFFLTWYLLPRLWHLLPKDRGKALTNDGELAKGKPTGAGVIMIAIAIPIIFLVFPFTTQSWYILGLLMTLILSMLSGYCDDKSISPWGESRKFFMDIAISLAAAWLFCCRPTQDIAGQWHYYLIPQPMEIWFPLIKQFGNMIPEFLNGFIWFNDINDTLVLHPAFYLFISTCILTVCINATNCSDGVDNLAGMLALISLLFLAAFLYIIVGHTEFAEYLLIPHHAGAPRWALIIMCIVGSLFGYIWHNAWPSDVMMGDAGSRMLGLLLGISVLFTGNPFMIVAVMPMILLNGGSGLVKLLILRLFRLFGSDISSPTQIKSLREKNPEYVPPKQHCIIHILHKVRFPLHDHFKITYKWTPARIMVRFLIIQTLATPFLILLFIKLR